MQQGVNAEDAASFVEEPVLGLGEHESEMEQCTAEADTWGVRMVQHEMLPLDTDPLQMMMDENSADFVNPCLMQRDMMENDGIAVHVQDDALVVDEAEEVVDEPENEPEKVLGEMGQAGGSNNSVPRTDPTVDPTVTLLQVVRSPISGYVMLLDMARSGVSITTVLWPLIIMAALAMIIISVWAIITFRAGFKPEVKEVPKPKPVEHETAASEVFLPHEVTPMNSGSSLVIGKGPQPPIVTPQDRGRAPAPIASPISIHRAMTDHHERMVRQSSRQGVSPATSAIPSPTNSSPQPIGDWGILMSPPGTGMQTEQSLP